MRMKMKRRRRRRRRRRKSWKRRKWKRTSLVTCMTISLPALSLAIWRVEVISVDHWDCWSHQRRSLRWLKSSKWITEIVLFVLFFYLQAPVIKVDHRDCFVCLVFLFVGTSISCYFSCFILGVKVCCCWEKSFVTLSHTAHLHFFSLHIYMLCLKWLPAGVHFDLNVNWCSLCLIWLSAGVHFVWFGCQLVFSLSDLIASWCSVCLIWLPAGVQFVWFDHSWCSVCLIWS